MSNFKTTARQKGSKDGYISVTMLEDYFGPHKYGVLFPGAGVLPESECEFTDGPREGANQQTQGEEKGLSDKALDIATYYNELPRGHTYDGGMIADLVKSEVKAKLAEVLTEVDQAAHKEYTGNPVTVIQMIAEIRTRLGISNHTDHE
jgi:hypothetical protein